MNEILFQYHKVNPTTWVYLSSLLMIGLYFKFSRFWSVRNFDLLLLIPLGSGMLLVMNGRTSPDTAVISQESATTETSNGSIAIDVPDPPPSPVEQAGYIVLFAIGGCLLVRLLLDTAMVRRPLLEANLSVGGLVFIGISLFAFLMANVLTGRPTREDLAGPRQADHLVNRSVLTADDEALNRWGPGYPFLFLLPHIPTAGFMESESDYPFNAEQQNYMAAARIMAILSHLAILVGIVVIGYRHFENLKTGISVAVLYLLLPYTAQMTGRVDHVLPSALLVWAVATYRRPMLAGIFIGLASGVIFYPAFLLPLWLSFYWRRGLKRFLAGVLVTLAVLVASLALTSDSLSMFLGKLKHMMGWRLPTLEPVGFWEIELADPAFRITVLAAFIVMCVGMAVWPARKNLGTLLSCTAAVMVATQFWHAHGGGLFVAWYLPLLLLTIFRPNLEDRVALSVLSLGKFTGNGWLSRQLSGRITWRERAAL